MQVVGKSVIQSIRIYMFICMFFLVVVGYFPQYSKSDTIDSFDRLVSQLIYSQ